MTSLAFISLCFVVLLAHLNQVRCESEAEVRLRREDALELYDILKRGLSSAGLGPEHLKVKKQDGPEGTDGGDNFKGAGRHKGFDSEGRHKGFDSEGRHKGFDSEGRHKGFDSEGHHKGFDSEGRHKGFKAGLGRVSADFKSRPSFKA